MPHPTVTVTGVHTSSTLTLSLTYRLFPPVPPRRPRGRVNANLRSPFILIHSTGQWSNNSLAPDLLRAP